MTLEPTDIDSYTSISRSKGLPPRCPFASVHRCPRYFQSLALFRHAGTTAIPPADEEALTRKWQSSELWPVVAEQVTSIMGEPGDPHLFSHFCPEVAYDRFGIFSSSFARYPTVLDRELAHEELGRERAPGTDWRWHWSAVSPAHYSDCEFYSPLTHDRDRPRPATSSNDEIVELRPNFLGLGVNLRALFRWMSRFVRRTQRGA
jgi:hypothetical protein